MVDTRDAAKEEIRRRIPILDLVSEYVSLKRAGRRHNGLCPFHADKKTPSFTVSEEFQTWHCFGCGEHGDVFSFLMKIENLTFAETLERLAKRAGVQLDRLDGKQTSRRELLGKINTLAAVYYSESLERTPDSLNYLRERGLAEQTIEQFRLGYAGPDWDGLLKLLNGKGYKTEDAVEAGLIVKGERNSFYDRFRHRIVFPIFDIQERIIGFGGRALDEDQQPKYLNSPETPLFIKTRSLYGLNFARKSISGKGYALVVEGYTDVIAAHQSDFSNCVATLGTALTSEHIKVLSRYASKVILAYDADSAGMKAALRGAAMFEEAESDVRIARLPAGEDPDGLLRKGRIAEFEASISAALPIIEFKLASLEEQFDLSGTSGRAAMLKQAVKVIAEVPASIEREKHIRSMAKYHPNFESGTTRAEEHIRRDVERLTRRAPSQAAKASEEGAPKPMSALEKAERSVLRALIRGEMGTDAMVGTLSPEDFSGDINSEAARLIMSMIERNEGIYLAEVLEVAQEEVGRLLSELAASDDGPPISEKALEDYIALIKNAKTRKKRTSDILAPYINRGLIDASKENTIEELETFLKTAGKLPEAN